MTDASRSLSNRMTITIEECPLPPTAPEREMVYNDVAAAVRTALPSADGQTPHEITVRTGYHYTQVGDACPHCQGQLVVDSVRLTKDNKKAHADVWCGGCKYSGMAVFPMVDIEGSRGHDPVFKSAVLTGALTPSYEPY